MIARRLLRSLTSLQRGHNCEYIYREQGLRAFESFTPTTTTTTSRPLPATPTLKMYAYRPLDIKSDNILVSSPLVRSNEDGHNIRRSRTRVVYRLFGRAPDGHLLDHDSGPLGFRTPNGLVWGHALDELGFIAPQPGLSTVAAYSRSQLKELGELYNDDEFEGPLVRPRVRRPWPVLKLPKEHPANTNPPLGAIDQGCEEAHCQESECRTYTVRWDEFSDDERTGPGASPTSPPLLRCSSELPEACRGHLEPNDTSPPLVNAIGDAYHYLWCDHFLERLKAHKRPLDLVARVVHKMDCGCVAGDKWGVFVYDTLEEIPLPLPLWVRCLRVPISDDTEPAIAHLEPLLDSMVLPDVRDSDDSDADLLTDDNGPEDEKSAEGETPADDHGMTPLPGMFSVQDLPKLEEFIPEALFPDVLLVHDPQRLTNREPPDGDEPVKYKRIYPVLQRASAEGTTSDEKEELVAHLHLDSANQLGSGHHSHVYCAPLTLPPPLSARSRTGQCTVAAKLAQARCTAHRLLHNEADIYNAFPKHAQEEYCGLNIVPPCFRYPVPVGAIVPKFFGFYEPVTDPARRSGVHRGCSENRPCSVDWMSPILLMEECGEPVEPRKFTADQRYVPLLSLCRFLRR